ncbi:beta-2-glycoprotein 1-like [Osmerus eperlanus]|uniref:beta-2-glycoprotein 1-like n=1 Tax=Osmerus eperlanus TaxID=29151 RepID=UPI002E1178FE
MAPALNVLLLCTLALFTTAASVKVCGRPPGRDGIDATPFKRVYEIGEEEIITCERGYIPSSSPGKIVCSPTGEWTKPQLVCAPKMCSIPKPLQSLTFGKKEVPYKSVLNYTCDDGYVLIGANNSQCLHDGSWSHPPPLCTAVSCSLPQAPQNGKVVYDNKEFKGNTTIYGQGWTFECLPPRAPIGNERGSCLANGTVTEPPVCREVSCPIPKGIDHGFITFAVKREHSYKEKVKYGCSEHYVLDGNAEMQCDKTGNWSNKPVCRAPCTVGIKRGRIFYNAKKMWIGDFKPNRVLHGEPVVFYCLNKEQKCGYPVASTCLDGTLKVPECFEEPGKLDYSLRPKSLPSEISMCAANLNPNPKADPKP